MEDWKKGSYYFPDMENQEKEIEILKQNSGSASEIEKSIWSELGINDNPNVLDLGCGPGFISIQLAEFFSSGKVMGIDVSRKLIDVAEHERKKRGIRNLKFKQSNIYDLNVPEKYFDLIYSRFVFQHLTHPVEALKSAVKALKPEGIMCVVDIDDSKIKISPRNPSYSSFLTRAAKEQAKRGGDRYIGNKLKGLFKEAGLRDINEQIITVSSRDVGLETFLDMTIRFKLPCIPESEKEESLKEEKKIYSETKESETIGTFDVYVVTGQK